jgi:hypothetical protein
VEYYAQGKTEVVGKNNLYHWHFVHHKSHADWPGIEPATWVMAQSLSIRCCNQDKTEWSFGTRETLKNFQSVVRCCRRSRSLSFCSSFCCWCLMKCATALLVPEHHDYQLDANERMFIFFMPTVFLQHSCWANLKIVLCFVTVQCYKNKCPTDTVLSSIMKCVWLYQTFSFAFWGIRNADSQEVTVKVKLVIPGLYWPSSLSVVYLYVHNC